MSAIIGAVVALGILAGGGFALRSQARAQRLEDAISLGCPRCEDALPGAACTCLGYCGRHDCRPGTWTAAADLYPREDVAFLRSISTYLAAGGER